MFNDYFDDMLRLLSVPASASFPPYDIVEVKGGNKFRLAIAVAGFNRDELSVEADGTILTVRGEKQQKEDEEVTTYHHRGIARRNFELRFRVADSLRVSIATMQDGLLVIEWEKSVEDSMTLIPIK